MQGRGGGHTCKLPFWSGQMITVLQSKVRGSQGGGHPAWLFPDLGSHRGRDKKAGLTAASCSNSGLWLLWSYTCPSCPYSPLPGPGEGKHGVWEPLLLGSLEGLKSKQRSVSLAGRKQ
jgi:hypothetical protein